MPINYPSPEAYNPFSRLQQGIATGMQLGGMRQRGKPEQPEPASDAAIPDPGEKPQANASNMLQAEYEDVLRYEDINKKIKKIKNITPEQRQKLMQRAVQSGIIKTPIVQSIVLNDDLIEPEEVVNIMKSIKSNQPSSAFDIEMLVTRLGGETSVGGGAVKTKLAEIEETQNKLNEQRKIILKGTLRNIDQYLDNPKQYQGKSGISDPQTLGVVKKWPEYIKELSQLDPEWAKKYLEEREAKRAGYKPRQVEFSGFTKDKRRVVGTHSTAQGFMRAHPEVVPSTVRQSERETFMYGAMGGGFNVNQQIKKESKGGVATDEIIQQYIKKYGKDKALQKLKEDGYR
jgi:hypothetical protein